MLWAAVGFVGRLGSKDRQYSTFGRDVEVMDYECGLLTNHVFAAK